MKSLLTTIAALLVPLSLSAQVTLSRQQKFPKDIPPGDYSGITSIGNGRYAVVSDKTPEGFYIFRIDIDTLRGKIQYVQNEGFFGPQFPGGLQGRADNAPRGQRPDQEAICYVPATRTLFISRESDNQTLEYTMDGQPTGRRLAMPENFGGAIHNDGLESLCYDSDARLFWTVTEGLLPGDSLLRLQSFGDDLQPCRQYLYPLNPPLKRYRRGNYVHGVSELMPVGNGRLLVLERAVRVPRPGLASFVQTWLYEVQPAADSVLQKRLVSKWRTRINLLRRNLANYEGMCEVGRLNDGRHLILLITDSQNQLKGVLRDWLRLVAIP